MPNQAIDEERLKELLESAIFEVLEERKDLLRDLFEEALGDIALAHALEEGEQTCAASRKEIFKALEGSH